MNPKREKLGTCGLEGIKGSLAKPPWSGLRAWHLAWGVKSYFLGVQILVAKLGFFINTCLNPIDWIQSQQS